ncbi:MAG: iron ABC transporter substrate-binding protein [Chloroflexi bacterium]|nr:iron ABC transporter substrate-binding protein [Chloroflexota bacterium]
MASRLRARPLALFASLSLAVLAACTPASPGTTSAPATGAQPTNGASGSLTVYSGRSESLVAPLIERFRTETGIDVQVKYGDTAELASTILEEGDASPADVFFAQDAGALGALADEGRLAALPPDLLERVDSRFRSPDGVWVGVSGRARVAAYNPDLVGETELPSSILEFTDPKWKGRLGWAPTNGSFQAFVSALRVLEGDDAARAWLEGIQANEPRVYEGNDPALSAVAAGEVHVAFINHYYLMRRLAEEAEISARNHFFLAGDPGALVNVAGAGILTTADQADAARTFIEYLLNDESQGYFAEETFEYPLVPGIPADSRLVPLEDIESPDIDLSDLSDLEGTLALLREAGVL